MKIPAVAIVTLFACGIALGLCFPVAHPYPLATILTIDFSAATLLILTGILLSKFEKLAPAAITSLLSWTLLGVMGALLSAQPRLANRIISAD